MSDFELFPKKCIKCQKENVDLHEFQYTRTRGLNSFKTVSISFPVCDSCEKDFKNYKMIGTLVEIFLFFAIGLTFFRLISTYMPITSQIRQILLILSIVCAILTIVFYFFKMIHPNRISRYISLKMDGRIKIKDSEYEKETGKHILEKKINESNKMEQEIDIVRCPKCGSKQFKSKDFCNNCGKELRIM